MKLSQYRKLSKYFPTKLTNNLTAQSCTNCTTLHWTEPYCTAVWCTELHCFALHCIELTFSPLHFTALHLTALHWTSLHWTAMHYTALYVTETPRLPTQLQLMFPCALTSPWTGFSMSTTGQYFIFTLKDVRGHWIVPSPPPSSKSLWNMQTG